MLSFQIRLRLGAFDAGSSDDPTQSEWPPHPARLFCALVAGDPSPQEWEALEWLEREPPPEVLVPEVLSQSAPAQFLVTNKTEMGGGSQTHPGRRQLTRVKPRLMPAEPGFAVVWPESSPSQAVLAALRRLAARVPYVGRATADADVIVTDGTEAPSFVLGYEPTTIAMGECDLRTPYPGYSERLLEAHNEGRPAWHESRRTSYRRKRPATPTVAAPTASPFAPLLTMAIENHQQLGPHLAAHIADQFRRATLRLVQDHMGSIDALISGHGAPGRDHVAFLALPNVGTPAKIAGLGRTKPTNPHADGRILGVGLAIPRAASEVSDALYGSLFGDTGRLDLRLGREGRLELTRTTAGSGSWAATSERWTAKSDAWVTATPLVLDRFPKRGADLRSMVAASLVTAGYPLPAEVGISRAPLVPGASTLSLSRVQRRSGVAVPPWIHAWVRFDSAVAGPVLAGSSRYRGLGLFAPVAREGCP